MEQLHFTPGNFLIRLFHVDQMPSQYKNVSLLFPTHFLSSLSFFFIFFFYSLPLLFHNQTLQTSWDFCFLFTFFFFFCLFCLSKKNSNENQNLAKITFCISVICLDNYKPTYGPASIHLDVGRNITNYFKLNIFFNVSEQKETRLWKMWKEKYNILETKLKKKHWIWCKHLWLIQGSFSEEQKKEGITKRIHKIKGKMRK